MKKQLLLKANGSYEELDQYLTARGIQKPLAVCDGSFQYLSIRHFFEGKKNVVYFSDFQPNPLYESVVRGVQVFQENKCDAIIAVGGGSAMDVAKCIKLYQNMDPAENYLKQEIVPNDIPLAAVPTTAGTGSEATRYAVIYCEGQKQSVTHESCIPDMVLFDASALKTLPLYQKKATMLDALCHSIESYWSVNSTDESREYSRQAIALILSNMNGYLASDDTAGWEMLKAANLAGRAINITQTTAGHAMCYKITSLYNTAHGHSAALVLRKLWPYMKAHPENCADARGEAYLRSVFAELDELFGGDGPERFSRIFDSLELEVPEAGEEDIQILAASVNQVRLKNNPVRLDEETAAQLYREILR
ncbi:MAG TPA: alcohol dehydrogenase [Erysipelotrichaceae bacterium]|nr:alcohol dehydrogenase [Erysipelotrichaceae bacterium]